MTNFSVSYMRVVEVGTLTAGGGYPAPPGGG